MDKAIESLLQDIAINEEDEVSNAGTANGAQGNKGEGDLGEEDFINELVITSDNGNSSSNTHIWNMRSNEQLATFKGGRPVHNALSMIGDDYLIGSIMEGTVINIWTIRGDRDVVGTKNISCPTYVTALDVDCSATYLVAALDTSIYLWMVKTGELKCIIELAHFQDINCIKFTENQRYFVSCSKDTFAKAWKLLDIFGAVQNKSKPKPKFTWIDFPENVVDLRTSRFGPETVLAVSYTICKIYSLESGECVFSMNNPSSFLTCSAVHSVNAFIFLGKMDGTVLQVDPNFGQDENTSPMKITRLHKLAVKCLDTSGCGRFLVSGSADKTAKIWSIYTSQVLQTYHHSGSVLNAFFHMGIPALRDKDSIPKIFIKKFEFEPFSYNLKDTAIKTKPLSSEKCKEMDELLKNTGSELQIDNESPSKKRDDEALNQMFISCMRKNFAQFQANPPRSRQNHY